MKKFFAFFLIFSLVLTLPTLALPALVLAADDDIIILDEDAAPQRESNPILGFMQRHLGLTGGGYWAGGGGNFEQSFGFGAASFDYPFKFLTRQGRIFVSGGYSYREVNLVLEITEGYPDVDVTQRRDDLTMPNEDGDCIFPVFEPGDLPSDDSDLFRIRRTCEFDIKVSDGQGELREAFFEYEILPDLVVAVGRQRPVWGQFNVFSVINALLPIEVQSREFGFSNNNLRMPQDAAIATWYPVEQVELSGYLFFQTTLDPLLRKALIGGNYSLFVDDQNNIPNSIVTDCGQSSVRCEVELSGDLDGEDDPGYAARALWRSDFFTLGLTFNQGHFSLFSIYNRLPMVRRYCAGNPFDAGCPDGVAENDVRAYNVIERLALPESTAYAVEFSVPIGAWSIRTEIAYVESQSDIGVYSMENRFYQSPGSVPDREKNRRKLFNWIIDNNNSEGFVDVASVMAQLGFDADYDQWHFGLNILLFTSILSDEADRANELYKLAYPNNDPLLEQDDFDGIPLPTIYAFYDFGLEKEHRIGFAAGFLGIVAGGSVFYTGSQLLNEHLNWTASVDYTTSIANFLIADANDNAQEDSDSELAEDFSLSFRVGITLEF